MYRKPAKIERWYPIDIKKKPKKPFGRHIPRAAAWGWADTPISTRFLIFGTFFSMVCFATPFWAYVAVASEDGRYSSEAYETFGLWHFCRMGAEQCTSIHDNIVLGKSVPVWYFMVQGTYTIGLIGALTSLAILTTYAKGITLHMTKITHNAVLLILGIGITQQLVGLYTFVAFFSDTDFLYDNATMEEIEFYGSFYCGIVGLICCCVTELILLLSDEIILPVKSGAYKAEFQDRMKQCYWATPPVYKVHVT